MSSSRIVRNSREHKLFMFTKARGPASFVLARKVVLWPLARSLELESMKAPAAGCRIVTAWRKRLAELAEAGYPRLSQFGMRILHGNCYPSMVKVEGEVTVTCDCPICPWCYGRKVQRLARLAGQDLRARHDEVFAGCRLWLSEHSTDVPCSHPDDTTLLHQTLATLAEACRSFCRGCRRSWRAFYWSVDAFPAFSKSGEAVWRAVSRSVGSCLADRPPAFAPPGWTHFLIDDTSPGRVAKVIRRQTQYPVRWVTGDVVSTVGSLLARRGLRLTEFSGLFRGGERVQHQDVDAGDDRGGPEAADEA